MNRAILMYNLISKTVFFKEKNNSQILSFGRMCLHIGGRRAGRHSKCRVAIFAKFEHNRSLASA